MNYENIHREELDHLFRSFCSYVCISLGKKYNIANILLLYLKNINVRNLFKRLMEVESDTKAVRIFLEFDPSLCKSKYIMKYINSKK